jgi:hypothetical protein
MADAIPTEYAKDVAYLADKANKRTLKSDDQVLAKIRTKANQGVKSLQVFLASIENKVVQV